MAADRYNPNLHGHSLSIRVIGGEINISGVITILKKVH